MIDDGNAENDDRAVMEVIGSQLEHFRNINPPCRGLELPDGVLLRHTQSRSLFFYLRTGVDSGKIRTQVFASDSPYERQKTGIGAVVTPMFEVDADFSHLQKLEKLIREWVAFVHEEPDFAHDFQSFKVNP
jgi:hypothetical protein